MALDPLALTALPNLHPALVHFPAALLPLAVALDAAALLFAGRPWVERAAATIWGAAVVGTACAFWAGTLAADGLSGLAPEVEQVISTHSDWGRGLAIATAVLGLLRVGIALWDRRSRTLRALPVRLALFAGALVLLVVLFRTADLGGSLVFQHAVAVREQPQLAVAPQVVVSEAGDPPEARAPTGPGGSRTWTPLAGDGTALGTVVDAAPGGSLDAVTPVPVPSMVGLALEVTGRAFLLFPESHGDVQVEVRLGLADFQGVVGVVHHLADSDSMDVFSVTSVGEASLYRLDDGTPKVLGKGRADLGSEVTLRVSAAGRHFKGFVDDHQVAHGHMAAAEPGRCGLMLDGEGVVRVFTLEVRPAMGR